MKCNELPVRLRIYILAHAVVLAPLACVPWGRWLSSGVSVDLLLLVLFTVIFRVWEVELTLFRGKTPLGFMPVCLAQLLQGLPAAVVCASAGAVAGVLRRPRGGRDPLSRIGPPWYRLAFSLGNSLAACLAASLAYQAAYTHTDWTGVAPLPALVLFTGVFFAISTLGMSLAIALQEQFPWFSVWANNYLRAAPCYLAAGCASAGIGMVYQRFHALSLFFLPPLYLSSVSYRLYMASVRLHTDKIQRDLAHAQELNQLVQFNHALLSVLVERDDTRDSPTPAGEPGRAVGDA